MKTIFRGSLIRPLSALAILVTLAAAQAQPTFSMLSFNANSVLGVTNVSVALTSTTLSGASRLKTLTPDMV